MMNKINVSCNFNEIDKLDDRTKIAVNRNRIENVNLELNRLKKLNELEKEIINLLDEYLKSEKIVDGYFVQMKAKEVRICFEKSKTKNLENTFYIRKRKEKTIKK